MARSPRRCPDQNGPARERLQAAVDELSGQLSRLRQSHARQRRFLSGALLLIFAVVALGAAVRIKATGFEIWPDAATGDPKSSHQLELIGTTGAAVQRSIVLQNKSIDGTSYRLDIRAGATEIMTLQSDGKIGVGTTDPEAMLEVAGQLKITGGTPGADKILTSDAAGLASWSTADSGTSPTTTSNTHALAADTDDNETDSKLFLEVDGANRMTVSGGGWNVTTASLEASFSVAVEEATPTSAFLKPDGTRMFVLGSGGDAVYEYSLSTTWDVSTASYVQLFSVSTEEIGPMGLFFKPDGTRMYVTGSVGDDVNEYSLSTAWNISTASFVQLFSVSAQESAPGAIFFKSDGMTMFILGFGGDEVNEYSLSTAWDVTTASFVRLFSVSTQETSPHGLFFRSDGTRMYVAGLIGDDVNEYSLSTAWDISTATYVRLFSVSADDTSPTSVFFKPDGTRMYVAGNQGNTIFQYRLTGSAPGFVGIGTTTPNYQLDVRGTIGSDTTEHHGADYAEWFEKDDGELLGPGDVIGLNPSSLKVRKYQPGDPFIGVYSTFPGTVGNRDHHKTTAQMRRTHALVGLLGQLPFDRKQASLDGGVVRTKDGKKIGLLLPDGKVLLVTHTESHARRSPR